MITTLYRIKLQTQKKSKHKFEKDCFNLIRNALFGITIANVQRKKNKALIRIRAEYI